MKSAITYTALSLANLIAFAIGIVLLPAAVPIHFDSGMVADLFGSPWVLISFPAAAALLTAAFWGIGAPAKMKYRSVYMILFTIAGCVLAVVGWVFFVLAASGVKEGETAKFPVVLVVVLTLSLFVLTVGSILPQICSRLSSARAEVWKKASSLGGILLFFAGLISAILSVAISCFAFEFAYISAIVLGAMLVISLAIFLVYAKVLHKHKDQSEL